MGKTLKYGGHEFPAKFGFSGSSKSGPVRVRSYVRKRSAPKAPKAPQKMASGGVPTPADYMEAPSMAQFPEVAGPATAVPGLRPTPPGKGGTALGHQEQMNEAVNRGFADLTAENIAKAIGFGATLSGTSPLSIAAGEALKAAGVPDVGLGLPEFTGKQAFTPEIAAAINAGKYKTIEEAARAQKAQQDANRNTADGGERGGRGAGLGGQGSQAGDIGGEPGMGGRKAFKKGGAVAQMCYAEGGKVTMPKVKATVDKKVMQHNRAPSAHRNMKAVPAFNNKPKFGDE